MNSVKRIIIFAKIDYYKNITIDDVIYMKFAYKMNVFSGKMNDVIIKRCRMTELGQYYFLIEESGAHIIFWRTVNRRMQNKQRFYVTQERTGRLDD